MNALKSALVGLVLSCSFVAASCAPESDGNPTITLSPARPPSQTFVSVRGSGFAPRQNVTSHLLEPDGREFPPLPILTDSEGRFTHEIDTLLLASGTHRLWVVDDASGRTSNVAEFEVTEEQPPVE